MIPVKILSQEEAERLGLKKRSKSGRGQIGVGIVVKGKKGEPGKLMEKCIIENNKKILIFIDKERERELKNKNQLGDYIKQFDVIPRGLK